MVRIALIDDDELVREWVGDLLATRGYETVAYAGAGAALDALRDDRPDLVLCDVEMPDGSGLDVVAALRAAHGDALPVLLLSGRAQESDIVRGFAAGATDYLTKPITGGELLAKVSVLLARAGAQASAASGPAEVALPGGWQKAFGRYRVQATLGQGSYGIVFRARDLVRGEDVALKVISTLVAQAEARMRFLRETYALAAVKHAHIVAVHDFGAAEGRLYYSMDLVSGLSVEAKVVAGGPATPAEARALLRGVATGLAALHAADVVHRDLKPANVLLRDGRWDRPVIVDFGLAKRPFDRGLTEADMIVGTPGYMPPEPILGLPLDPRSDLFSLGLVGRFALTGAEAFPGLSGLPLLKSLATRPVDLPASIDKGLRGVLRRLLQLELSRRTPSAAALVEELDRLPR